MPLPVRYVLAFCLPFAATLFVTPLAARLARRIGMIDHPREGRHHRSPTPYLGGLAVAVGLIVVGAVASGAERQLTTILLCGTGLGAVGFVDDWRTVHPALKVASEIAAAVALWAVGVRAGVFNLYVLDLGLTIFWVVLITNAINLLDNMDGLASGVVAIAALTFFAIAADQGDYLVASFALVIAGSSLGFLRHNFPPASIFLGDAGSLMLGFLLSALALKIDLVSVNTVGRVLTAALILGIPLFDTTLVVIARLREHRPIYLGGTDHSSHRLAQWGLSTRAVVILTYAAQVVSCSLALLLTHSPPWIVGVTLAATAAVAAAALWVMLRMAHPSGDLPVEGPESTGNRAAQAPQTISLG